MRSAVAFVLFVLTPLPAFAQALPPEAVAGCRALPPNYQRACFDDLQRQFPAPAQRQMPPKPLAPTTASTIPPPQPAPTPAPAPQLQASALAPDQDNVPRATIVDLMDLGIGTRKYMNRPIEVRGLHCFYADVSDYRCSGDGPFAVAIFAADIEPVAIKQFVEANCDTLQKVAVNPRCLFGVRFSYSDDDVEEDVLSGMRKRTVIKPATIILQPARPY